MSKRRPRFLPEATRQNAGIVSAQFIIHAALSHLPEVFGKGLYGRDSLEERIFDNLSHKQTEMCFNALQKRPPSVALRFPTERSQLPMITVARESMETEAAFLGEDAGSVPEAYGVVETETILTPEGGAVGGETVFAFPTVGDPISSSVDLIIRRSGQDIPLDHSGGEYRVDVAAKTITLVGVPVLAGDDVIVTRYGTYQLPGGDMVGMVFNYHGVILIDTENPILTTFLEGIVWRELMLQHDNMISSGLADIDFGFRDISQWDQIQPAIGYRAEIITTGFVEWAAYKRIIAPRGATAEFTTDADDSILQLSFDLVTWGDSPCSEE